MNEKLKNKDPFQITHQGKLKIGNKELICAVLQNGMRIISHQALFKCFNTIGGGKTTHTQLPRIIEGKKFTSLLTIEEEEKLQPIEYTTKSGAKKRGYLAESLPIVCDVMLQVKDLKIPLSRSQQVRAKEAEIIIRALSKVGITALVDEATGYEKQRENRALAKLLDLYLTDEYAAWSKLFPDSYYEEMFRLNGWSNKSLRQKPQCIGHYTNDVVYSRLAPCVLPELKSLKEQFKNIKSHQWFSRNIGHPALEQHLHTVIALMKVATDWNNFKWMLDKVLPKKEQKKIAA